MIQLKLKEDPKEWRKAALMSALGFAILSSVLRWRQVLGNRSWLTILLVLAAVAILSIIRPVLFRGWYRFSTKVGYHIGRTAGLVALALLFFIVVTPLGIVMRLLGKDPLRLRRPENPGGYWSPARGKSPLDRSF